MSKGIYVGALTEVPIYKETVTEFEKLSYDTRDLYFSRTLYSYSIIWDTASVVHGGLRYSAQNKGIHSSTGGAVFTALHDLKNVKVYCEYKTEKSWDKVTTIIAGETVMNEVSGTDNTALNLIWSGDLAAGEKIDCKYVKDNSTHASGEKVYWEITCDPLTEITKEIVGYETKELARKVKKLYVEADGLARKVKKGYIGVEGVARQFYSAGGFGSFSGDYTVSQVELDGATYDLYTLTSSGVLDVGDDDVQFWMCGGGSSGACGQAMSNSGYSYGGHGGSGGHVKSGVLESGKHAIVIGSGGQSATGNASMAKIGGTSSIDDAHIAYGGGNNIDGANGGSGGGAGGYAKASGYVPGNGKVGSHVSTIPFAIESLLKHCAGGAGGNGGFRDSDGSWTHGKGGYGGSNGSDGGPSDSGVNYVQPKGGEYGGGHGGYTNGNPTNATFYGSGGGGADSTVRLTDDLNYSSPSGAGYQGVCYLLIPA